MKRLSNQTYKEYLETMKAYGFHPLDRKTWEMWAEHYSGRRPRISGIV